MAEETWVERHRPLPRRDRARRTKGNVAPRTRPVKRAAGPVGSAGLDSPAMTYNFDPDRWYDNNLAVLEERRRRAELDEAAFKAAVAELDAQYDEMVDRLDHSYMLHE